MATYFPPSLAYAFEPMHYDALCTFVVDGSFIVTYPSYTGCFRKVDGMWFEIGRLHYHLLRWFGRNVMLARYE